VFQFPPPEGIKNLRVAGYASMSGEVLMTFQADDVEKVLSALKANPHKPLYGPDPKRVDSELYMTEAQRSPYRTKLAWPDQSRLASLPTYGFPDHHIDSGWAGAIFVDRKAHQAYVVGVLY
jgi:hypothetical protein